MSAELKFVNHWVDKHGWDQLSWRDNYGRGVWTAIAPPTGVLELIRDATQVRGNDQSELRETLLMSSLLPLRTGTSLSSAMTALESRLAELPAVEHARGSLWAVAVQDVYQSYREQLEQQSLERALGLGQERETRAVRDGRTERREAVKELAGRLEREFGVPCTALPRDASSTGRLVHIERCADGVSLAAVLTQSNVHVFSVPADRGLPVHVGHKLTVHERGGEVGFVKAPQAQQQVRLPQRSPRGPELSR